MRKHSFFLPVLLLLALAPHAWAEDMPSTGFFPVLPYNAGPDAAPQLVPIVSNHPLDSDHKGLARAVIVVHDISRNADATLSMMSGLAAMDNATTMIMAPQFLQDSDIARYATEMPEQAKMFARWPLDGWQTGGDSIAAAQSKSVSSFTVMDLLLVYLSDKTYFPDLQQIVIAGHGAGGDYVQHYAALGQAPDILDQQHLPVKFLVGNASSFLYMTAPRPQGGKQGFASIEAGKCPIFNSYPYGLDNINSYGKRVGPDIIKIRYITRAVYYLTGANAAKTDPLPDAGCAAMLEGQDRVARAMNYDIYLKVAFGDASHKLQTFAIVPKAGFEPAAIYGSACGMSILFGSGECVN